MAYTLSFDHLYSYDTRKVGITIPVVLKIGEETATTTAKLDTGASHCIFERFVGEELGLAIENGDQQTISTVTGSFTVYGHEVTISVKDFDFAGMVYFAADDGFKRNVLGRQGWLDRVRFGLVDYEGKLYLSRHDA
jgi:hypothetical protein